MYDPERVGYTKEGYYYRLIESFHHNNQTNYIRRGEQTILPTITQ